jgi:hypothetical protein
MRPAHPPHGLAAKSGRDRSTTATNLEVDQSARAERVILYAAKEGA